jgi:hypothetical protein
MAALNQNAQASHAVAQELKQKGGTEPEYFEIAKGSSRRHAPRCPAGVRNVRFDHPSSYLKATTH